jgi:hypothetical protein
MIRKQLGIALLYGIDWTVNIEVHPQIDPVLMKDSSDLRGNDSTESLDRPGRHKFPALW